MPTDFIKLNERWNAEPNAPCESIEIKKGILELSFLVNPWSYEGFQEGERMALQFSGCSQYRLGSTNDEGWFAGACRFSTETPAWGEFYEIRGDSKLDASPNDWITIGHGNGSKHYLFYLRDHTFECFADTFTIMRFNGSHHASFHKPKA